MTLMCPCCRATNDGPTCRRCKADLRLMQQCEDARVLYIATACHALKHGQFDEADEALARAAQLRPGADVQQYRATLALLEGNFDAALALLPHEAETR
jgi:methylphosphotriester-DNA--protein-cysteine methyltransferase